MSYTYNPTVSAVENIRLLLADQEQSGAIAAKYNGYEPIDVLAAKVAINNNARGTGGYPDDNITLSGTINAAIGEFADLYVSGDTYLSGGLSLGGRIYNYPLGIVSQTYLPSVRAVTGNTTAQLEEELRILSASTITDPSNPVLGFGYKVVLLNGTVTLGGNTYSDIGSLIYRVYKSTGWFNIHFKPHQN